MSALTVRDVAKMLDHSLLQQKLTDAELEAGCRFAAQGGVATVCIKPYAVSRAASILHGSGVGVCTVIGFPHGGNLTAVKVYETERAMDDGATELDMVVNIGKVKSGDWGYVEADIAAVTRVCHARGAIVKVIFENSMLDDAQKIQLCRICSDLRCDFVKTATGYGDGGATDADLKLMREHSASFVQVKAAGGVRTLDRLLEVRALGVTRVGATASPEILADAAKRFGG
jgi:deoxyribose-phosphate aldolase